MPSDDELNETLRRACLHPDNKVSTAARKGCKCRRCWLYRSRRIDKDMRTTGRKAMKQ